MFTLAAPVMLGLFVAKLLLFLTYELYYEGDDNYHWPAILGCIIVGVIAGLIVRKFIVIGVFFVGLACGWSLGSFIYGIALNFWPDGDVLPIARTFFFFNGFFLIITVIYSCKEPRQVVTYGTSLIGSFTIMHGWYYLVGGFPDELDLMQRLEHNEKVKLDSGFYVYCAALFLLFAVSAFIQKGADDNEEIDQALGGEGKDDKPSHVEMADA